MLVVNYKIFFCEFNKMLYICYLELQNLIRSTNLSALFFRALENKFGSYETLSYICCIIIKTKTR